MRLPESILQHRLDHWPVARLASVGPGGIPHQVPIVFARVHEALWSPVDGKPKSGRELARVRNLRARPAASLLLDAYGDDWSALWWIRVDARARVHSASAPERDPRLGAVLQALRAKYPQYASVPVTDARATLLEFEIARVSSWCASPRAAELAR